METNILEEKMLHEELIIDWNEISNIIHDFHFMETIRGHLVVGVSFVFFKFIIRYNLYKLYEKYFKSAFMFAV